MRTAFETSVEALSQNGPGPSPHVLSEFVNFFVYVFETNGHLRVLLFAVILVSTSHCG